ncbi:MAG: superoxide dismutase [Ni] [Candidatus Eiseniibacteriota bacterium]
MKKATAWLVAFALPVLAAAGVHAHCQVPCGIYDDAARLVQLREDAATISKAITNINDLAGKRDAESVNQATRWIMTKEEHASHIIEVVSVYFLTQKLKDVAAGAEGHADYLAALADHHQVMRAAMKTKQGSSLESAAALDAAIEQLAKRWP